MSPALPSTPRRSFTEGACGMAQLHKKVIALLRPHLRSLKDALEDLPGGRVSGVIISPSFESLSYQQRQAKLDGILKAGLSADELLKVGAIAALTPAGAEVK